MIMAFLNYINCFAIFVSWATAFFGVVLLAFLYYRKICTHCERIRRDIFARALGWGNYATMKWYIKDSLQSHYESALVSGKCSDDYMRGLEAGATVATKIVLRGIAAAINDKNRLPNAEDQRADAAKDPK